MNAYYNNFENTANTYIPSRTGRRSRRSLAQIIDRLLTFIDALLDSFSSSRTLRVVRVSVSVLCIFSVFGIIGGIEAGLIGWGVGAVITLLIAALEALCIAKCR